MIDHEQIKRNNQKTLILIIVLVLLAVCLLTLGIWQGLRRPEMSKTQESPELGQATGLLVNGKDLLLHSENGDISVYIFGCPKQVNGTIVMTPMGEYINDLVASDAIWTRPTTVNISFTEDSKATGGQFSEVCSIRVCYVLTDEQWTHYQAAEDDLASQYLETEDGETPFWVYLFDFSKPVTHELCADYHKLGLYALAVKNLPAPVTGALYEPGQISITPTATEPGIYEP